MTVPKMEFNGELVRDVARFKAVKSRFELTPIVSFDLETVSLEDHTVMGVCLGIPPINPSDKGYAVYFGCESDCEIDFEKHLKPFLEILFKSGCEIVGHNLKFDLSVLRNNYFENIPQNIFDTMIASHMTANHERRHSLDAVVKRILGITLLKDLMDIRKIKDKDADLYWKEMKRYGTGDAMYPLILRQYFIEEFEKHGLVTQFKELEMPMVHVTAEMQMAGIPVDVDHLASIEPGIRDEAESAKAEVFKEVGYDFNLGSPVQLSKALFEDMGIATLSWMKRGKPRGKAKTPGAWPTNEKVMKSLVEKGYPVCNHIMTFRKKMKLLNTYVVPMQALALSVPERRLYTNFNQAGTATGRYSSSKPFNGQNMPRQKGLIRRAIAAKPGFKIVACDYSQIELRLMAHQSRDPVMIEAYKQGADLHRKTAAAAAGIDESEVKKEHRQMAKAINFGFLYGMSAASFQAYAKYNYGVEVSEENAFKFRDAYFNLYRGIQWYHDEMRDFVNKHGFTYNIIGEKRFLPDYKSPDTYLRWRAWSEGVNYTIQGSAAALIKVAMRNIYNELIRPHGLKKSTRYGRILTCWKSPSLAHEVRLFLQVHDELVFEVREEIAEPFAKWLAHKMETAVTGFMVPIVAEYGIADTFEEAH